ncbi:MAG: thrombospondin type 3 repeat-containing protein [Patescibacteria group bacterium]
MNFDKEKYLKYLPSKKFMLITSACIVLAIIIFVIFFMSSSGESFFTGNKETNNTLKVGNQSIADLIQNDTDGDGIADWEEALWGTDKNKKITFNDTPDATYIENKKKELKIEGSVNETKLTETEKFAREFFTSYSAMKSSGQVDDETINSFSNALGQKIVNPNLIDQYTETDIKINEEDDSISKQKYYESIKKLFKSYQSAGIGDELDIVSKGLVTNSASGAANDTDQYSKLSEIANAYQDFAKKIMEVSVPQSLTEYHLQIANNANNTGISVSNMSEIVSDPIVGLSGLSQYQKYSDDLIKAVADLENFLLKE